MMTNPKCGTYRERADHYLFKCDIHACIHDLPRTKLLTELHKISARNWTETEVLWGVDIELRDAEGHIEHI